MLSTKVIQNNSLQMLFMAQWGITKEVCPRFPRMRQHDLGQIRGAGRILDCAARQRTIRFRLVSYQQQLGNDYAYRP